MEQIRTPIQKVAIPLTWLHYASLGVGDLLMIQLFAIIGRRSHGAEIGWQAVAATIETAVPFFVAWLIVAPLAGAYRIKRERDSTGSSWDFVMPMLRAWLIAWPLALMLRSLLLQREIILSFALVTLATNTLLLGSWRLLYGWWYQRTQ